jgi:hypothetical protein
MAIVTSDQLVDGYRKYPIDDHGKLRYQYFSVAALTVALAANDEINLFRLPPGRKRVLPNLSRFTCSAFGAARVLDIGYRAFQARPVPNAAEVEDDDAFVANLDVSAALASVVWSTVMKYDMYSVDEITIFATVEGGTMPIGASLSGLCAYLYE